MEKKQTKTPIQKPIAAKKAVAQKQEKPGFPLNFKLALLLALISLLVYGNTLKNGFVLDDFTVVTKNTMVTRGIAAIPEILATPHGRGFAIISNDLYRPLSLAMFAIEYQFFGDNPTAYHFMNILLFACCVVLLFLFLDKLFERKRTSVVFIASLLFALHPIHTEVVANIKSRDELLCFFFAFLSLNIFISYVEKGRIMQLIFGGICFFLALLSKETAITFIVVIPLIFFFYRNGNKKESVQITVCAVVMAAIFLAIRYLVLNFYHANEFADIGITSNALDNHNLSHASRIATAILILGKYIKLLFVPYPLVSDYGYNSIPYVSFSNAWVLLSLAIYIVLLAFSVKMWLKNQKDPYAFGILFFLITISLFSNIFILIGSTMGERFMFFPSAGFCLALAFIIDKLVGKPSEKDWTFLKNPGLLGIIIPLSLVYTYILMDRNRDWIDNYTLYSTDVKNSPNSAKLNYMLAFEMENSVAATEKDPAKLKMITADEIKYLNKSIAVYPGYDEAVANLGFIYFNNMQYDSAEVYSKKAIELQPENYSATNNLACILFTRKNYREAVDLFKKVIKLNPGFVNAYANTGACYYYLNNFDSAIYYLNQGVSVDPSFNSSYEILANTYKAKGDMNEAGKYERIAQKNHPGFKL